MPGPAMQSGLYFVGHGLVFQKILLRSMLLNLLQNRFR